MKNTIVSAVVSAVVAVVIALLGVSLFGGGGTGGTSRAPNVDAEFKSVTTSDGFTATGTSSFTGTTTVGVLDASEFTQGGGIATLTDANGGTYTLTSTELLNNNILKFAAGGAGQEVIALTFPASSTLSAIIPNAGDFREWVYDANALAAATTTTITAGTGMNIIAVTTADNVIDGAEFSRISCWRQADTDITCIVSELLHAD